MFNYGFHVAKKFVVAGGGLKGKIHSKAFSAAEKLQLAADPLLCSQSLTVIRVKTEIRTPNSLSASLALFCDVCHCVIDF